ncbi:phosphoribulokinase / uridine kinase family protein [Alcanivorax balearicus MACL04]|uniref:Phosphoribulokinase / uridine kinase family protein n=1 Tax=Alloalcanivorax balearicus MACL04 TaxID=1177182 RepID=A0ABT2R039_9GAMM|nr:hypothetical protein [Alloalcanivorax balearicus]MCU5783145.1 phosphoribulokinase / uridine kinase family protein [Alloalcanivorax balearicus MACL04]
MEQRKRLLQRIATAIANKVNSATLRVAMDRPVVVSPREATRGDVLLFDGIFLQRPELSGYWDLSLYLDIRSDTSVSRLQQRDSGPCSPDHPLNRRYTGGQAFYRQRCHPMEKAHIIVDNNEVARPFIVKWDDRSPN